ncbi:MAG TPA: neutral/alkaline non-lysosomal ceramidase N-terminal domain-containing protein [Bacteroidales bacterium]|nr:neutral/alkaline non-lysosomal ceramidase N-terminal domain-containing protein [Bacteroidales bacterium]
MKKIVSTFIVFTVILILPSMAYCQNKTAGKSVIKMGASQVNITPPAPTVMAGYAARTNPSTGVHDSLFASALYFTGDKVKSMIISVDLIGFTSAYVDELKGDLSKASGVAPENIMIAAVHNHGAPSPRSTDSDVTNTVPAYVKFLKERLIALSVNATKNPVPVKMGLSKGECKMNINRRAMIADGSIWLGRNPEGPCDHDLVVAKFVDMNNKTVAVLINWPCHGTVSGQDNTLITGDWPGAAARYIKKKEGRDIVVAVTAGASGDINPLYGPGKNFTEIEAIGFHVANEVNRLLDDIKTYPLKEVQTNNTVMEFPGKKPSSTNLPQGKWEPVPDNEIRLTLFKIGDLVLSGISGELVNEIGMDIKKRSPYSETIVVTHCNGSSGYICTDKMFSEGGYEVRVTRFMPGVEKPLADKYIELIHQF